MTRAQEMLGLVAKGLTLQEIGDCYGLTRQRIHQIIPEWRAFAPKCSECGALLNAKGLLLGLCARHRKRLAATGSAGPKVRPPHVRKCSDCGKKRPIYIRDPQLCRACGSRWQYRQNPKRRAAIQESARQWKAENGERLATYRKNWRRARKADPKIVPESP
jgi:hypothetical protein